MFSKSRFIQNQLRLLFHQIENNEWLTLFAGWMESHYFSLFVAASTELTVLRTFTFTCKSCSCLRISHSHFQSLHIRRRIKFLSYFCVYHSRVTFSSWIDHIIRLRLFQYIIFLYFLSLCHWQQSWCNEHSNKEKGEIVWMKREW